MQEYIEKLEDSEDERDQKLLAAMKEIEQVPKDYLNMAKNNMKKCDEYLEKIKQRGGRKFTIHELTIGELSYLNFGLVDYTEDLPKNLEVWGIRLRNIEIKNKWCYYVWFYEHLASIESKEIYKMETYIQTELKNKLNLTQAEADLLAQQVRIVRKEMAKLKIMMTAHIEEYYASMKFLYEKHIEKNMCYKNFKDIPINNFLFMESEFLAINKELIKFNSLLQGDYLDSFRQKKMQLESTWGTLLNGKTIDIETAEQIKEKFNLFYSYFLEMKQVFQEFVVDYHAKTMNGFTSFNMIHTDIKSTISPFELLEPYSYKDIKKLYTEEEKKKGVEKIIENLKNNVLKEELEKTKNLAPELFDVFMEKVKKGEDLFYAYPEDMSAMKVLVKELINEKISP